MVYIRKKHKHIPVKLEGTWKIFCCECGKQLNPNGGMICDECKKPTNHGIIRKDFNGKEVIICPKCKRKYHI